MATLSFTTNLLSEEKLALQRFCYWCAACTGNGASGYEHGSKAAHSIEEEKALKEFSGVAKGNRQTGTGLGTTKTEWWHGSDGSFCMADCTS